MQDSAGSHRVVRTKTRDAEAFASHPESIRECSRESLRAPENLGKKASMQDELDAKQDESVQERSGQAELLGIGQARHTVLCESMLQVHSRSMSQRLAKTQACSHVCEGMPRNWNHVHVASSTQPTHVAKRQLSGGRQKHAEKRVSSTHS